LQYFDELNSEETVGNANIYGLELVVAVG
jgi:hypothetical protein